MKAFDNSDEVMVSDGMDSSVTVHQQVPQVGNDDISSSSSSSKSTEELERLTKSNRLKGYITMAFLSSLAFVSAYESDLEHSLTSWYSEWFYNAELDYQASFVRVEVIPSSANGRIYAMVVSATSAIFYSIITLIHIADFVFGIPFFRKAFRPGSIVECVFLVLSLTWWIFGTWILTSLHGIAGDGRGQYNLYFSIWLSTFTNIDMLEKWLKAAGYASIFESISSWPNRAPGWIVIFISTLATLLSILDLFVRHARVDYLLNGEDESEENIVWWPGKKYKSIKRAEWTFLVFACVASIAFSIGFSIVELFRREDRYVNNIKSDFELHAEGICLFILVAMWVPAVVYATTDGACSEIGNSYFCTWASAVVVIQTFTNWVQDWRRGVHKVVLTQYREYRRSQQYVEGIHHSDCDEDDEEDDFIQPKVPTA